MPVTEQMNNSERLELARALVDQLEDGNEQEATRILSELASSKDRGLFQEVGRLTRELHDSIEGFLVDSRIPEMAEHEIPDAGKRLNYVISMTEQSANATLNAVEASLPLADELGARAGILARDWRCLQEREVSAEEFQSLSSELSGFLLMAGDYSGQLHGRLSEVLMAQDFQDLTGQVIRQVIALIQDLEEKLVQLVCISGFGGQEQKPDRTKLEGPVISGLDQGDVVDGQDDVDQLLSSLGF